MWMFLAAAVANPMLGGFEYPHDTQQFAFVSQGKAVQMTYMDVSPEAEPVATVVLMHGKNFCGATWRQTITVLVKEGYRVIVPDQLGFCKSSKPDGYQYGLHTLAANTHQLLDALGVQQAIVMGHSMGGMLAARYAIQYPDATQALVMVNPIGLEDWRALGVPNATVEEWHAAEKRKTREGIKSYQKSTYYVNQWKPEYDEWVDMLWSMYTGPGGEIITWHQALISDMIFNQPVVHDLSQITSPTLLFIGHQDNTALGKGRAPEALKATLGNYAQLATQTADAIETATLVRFKDLGHSPHLSDPERFHKALLKQLKRL